MVLSTLSQLIAGGIVGLGAMLMIWSKMRQAEAERARADSLASWIGGKRDAEAAEQAAEAAAQSARNNPGTNPLDW